MFIQNQDSKGHKYYIKKYYFIRILKSNRNKKYNKYNSLRQTSINTNPHL